MNAEKVKSLASWLTFLAFEALLNIMLFSQMFELNLYNWFSLSLISFINGVCLYVFMDVKYD